MAEITNITKKTIERSKIVASKIEDKDLRKRVYALNIAANTTAEYLSANGLPADSKLSLFRIPSFAKNMELADVYVKGIRLDVRLTFDGNTFTIPKIQEKYNAKPAAYVVVQLSKDLTKAQILGFVPSEELGDSKSNSEYLTYQISVLKPLQQLRAFVSSVSVEQHIFSSAEHEKIKELCTAFLDEEISESEKVYFIKHVIGCPVCRETFCDLNDFDVIVSQVKNYHELLNDSTLSVLSGNKKEVNEAALANLAVVENAQEISEETPIAEPFLQEENISEIEESNEAVSPLEVPPILPMGVPAIEEETQVIEMDLLSDSEETPGISQDMSDMSDLSDLLDENNENESLTKEQNEKEGNEEQTPQEEPSAALEEELLTENTEESVDLLEDIAEIEELTQEPVELEMIKEETVLESVEENQESNEENIETESQEETLSESTDETSEETEVLENVNADEIEPLENLNDLEDTGLELEDLETLDAIEPEIEPEVVDEIEPNQELTVEPEGIGEIDEVEQITEISEIQELTDIHESIDGSIDEIQDITDDLTLIEPESLDELHEESIQEIKFEEIRTEEPVLELSETVDEEVLEEKEPFVLSLEGEEEEIAQQHEPIELIDEDEDENEDENEAVDPVEDETIQEDTHFVTEEPVEDETAELDADIQGLLDDDLLALLSDDAQSEQEISEPISQPFEAEPSLKDYGIENPVEQTETLNENYENYENYDIAQEPVQNEQFEDYTESDEDMISLDDEQQSFAQTEEGDSSYEASQGDDTIESLYSDTNVPQSEGDDPAQFELAQEPVSATTVNATKKIIVGAAVFLLLAGGGAASWFFNHAKTQNDADIDTANPDAEMFNLQNTAGKDTPEAPAISQDLNKSMTNSFSDKPAAITITKLSWQVSEKLAQEASVKEYLQTAGKNIQMNLQNDLANSADINFNNSIKISFEIAPDNTLKGMQVLESSGSDQIDDIVLRSIKNTLKYVSVPKLKDFKSDYFLTLIINF